MSVRYDTGALLLSVYIIVLKMLLPLYLMVLKYSFYTQIEQQKNISHEFCNYAVFRKPEKEKSY